MYEKESRRNSSAKEHSRWVRSAGTFHFVSPETNQLFRRKGITVDTPAGQNDFGVEEGQFEKEAISLIDEFTGMAE